MGKVPWVLLAALAFLGFCVPVALWACDFDVVVTGAAGDRGYIRVALFESSKGFPDRVGLSVARAHAVPRGGRASVRFTGLPEGSYGVSAFHDEDGDGQVDSSFLGIPKEKIGISNNPEPRIGPPRFEDAKIQCVGHGRTLMIELRQI